MAGRVHGLTTARRQVQGLIDRAPLTWRAAFEANGLGSRPTYQQVVETILERTAGGAPAGPRGGEGLIPPWVVRSAAMQGLVLSHQADYAGWNGIGLARAVQLVTQDTIWPRSVSRMYNFFHRNNRYAGFPDFGRNDKPADSWLAWLNWGGTPGYLWSADVLDKQVVFPRKALGKIRVPRGVAVRYA